MNEEEFCYIKIIDEKKNGRITVDLMVHENIREDSEVCRLALALHEMVCNNLQSITKINRIYGKELNING